MKRNTTFGGRSTVRRKKAKVAKGLAITSAVLLLLTFVVKEILKEQLKDFRDSIVSAQNQFRNQLDQSTVSTQILTEQQQLEAIQAQERTRNDPNHDYTLLIQQATAEARQAQAQLNADFDGVSHLIDAIPEAQQLRELRSKVEASVQKANQQVDSMLQPKPKHDLWRYVEVKMAMVMALVQELPVVVLGDAAQNAARRVQEAVEKLIKICNRAIYLLGFLSLGLGLYAAITGIQAAE
jgi:hypothetical protein